MNEPYVHVGILFEPQIEFVLNGTYLAGGEPVAGKQTATYDNGRILWNGRVYDELLFEPQDESTASFDLLDVTIGIGFHWERREDQRFQGALKIIVEDGKLKVTFSQAQQKRSRLRWDGKLEHSTEIKTKAAMPGQIPGGILIIRRLHFRFPKNLRTAP